MVQSLLFDHNGVLSPNQLMENFCLYFYTIYIQSKFWYTNGQPTLIHINQFLCHTQAQINMEKY